MMSTGWTVWELQTTAPSLSNSLIIKTFTPCKLLVTSSWTPRRGKKWGPTIIWVYLSSPFFSFSLLYFSFHEVFSYKWQTNFLKKYFQEIKWGKRWLKLFQSRVHFTLQNLSRAQGHFRNGLVFQVAFTEPLALSH